MILGPAAQPDPRLVVWQGSQTQPFLKCCWVWWVRRDPGTRSCRTQACRLMGHASNPRELSLAVDPSTLGPSAAPKIPESNVHTYLSWVRPC